MKRATKQELDVGLSAAHQAIQELQEALEHARTAHEADKLQERLDRATEDLDAIETEIQRRRNMRAKVYC